MVARRERPKRRNEETRGYHGPVHSLDGGCAVGEEDADDTGEKIMRFLTCLHCVFSITFCHSGEERFG
jgi:hypothetical protein